MSGRWRHPNRTTERVYNKRPRRYKPEPKILRRVEEILCADCDKYVTEHNVIV